MQFELNACCRREIHHQFPPTTNLSNDRRIFPFGCPQSDLVTTNTYRHHATGNITTERLSIPRQANVGHFEGQLIVLIRTYPERNSRRSFRVMFLARVHRVCCLHCRTPISSDHPSRFPDPLLGDVRDDQAKLHNLPHIGRTRTDQKQTINTGNSLSYGILPWVTVRTNCAVISQMKWNLSDSRRSRLLRTPDEGEILFLSPRLLSEKWKTVLLTSFTKKVIIWVDLGTGETGR